MLKKYNFEHKRLSFKEIFKLPISIPKLKLKNHTKINFIINNIKLENYFLLDQIVICKIKNNYKILKGNYMLSVLENHISSDLKDISIKTKLDVCFISLDSEEDFLYLKDII